MIAGGSKSCRILGAIKRIGKKHRTEKHYLGDEKYPHAKRARLALLLEVLKVMLQRRVACLMFNCNAVCQVRLQFQVSSFKFQVSKVRVSGLKYEVPFVLCLLPGAYCLLLTQCSPLHLSTCLPPASLPAAQIHMPPRSPPASPGNFLLAAAKGYAIQVPASARGLLLRVCHNAWTRRDKSPVSKVRSPVSTRPPTTTH